MLLTENLKDMKTTNQIHKRISKLKELQARALQEQEDCVGICNNEEIIAYSHKLAGLEWVLNL